MNKPKLTLLQQEIVRLLFINTGKVLNQRRIAQFLEVSAPAVMKALPYLEKIGWVNIHQDQESKRWSIELKRDNHRVMQLKRVDNLKQLYESGFVDYIEKECAGSTIILFGSYSRGDDVYTSDIDIAVVGRAGKQLSLSAFETVLQRTIHINFYQSWNTVHIHLKENLCNGIVLAGGVEL